MSIYPVRRAWHRVWRAYPVVGCVLVMMLWATLLSAAPPQPAAPRSTPVISPVPGSAADLLAPDIKAIVDRGALVVAMTQGDQPPFYYVGPDGQLAGLDATLARGIAARLGVPVRFERSAKSFNEVIELVARGGADVGISKLSRTLNRAKMVRFSKPYVTFRHAMLFNRLRLAQQRMSEEMFPTLLRGLKGPVGVIGQSSYENFLGQYFPTATAVAFPTWDEAVAAVFTGQVLAVYRDELEIHKINHSRKDASITLKTVIYKDMKDAIAMAVAWNRPHLAFWLDLYLDTFPTDQRAADILRTYMPSKEQP